MPSTQQEQILEKKLALFLRVNFEAHVKFRQVTKNMMPVLELPCPRRNGKDIWPSIVLQARVCQKGEYAGIVQNVHVPKLEGKTILFKVANLITYQHKGNPPNTEYKATIRNGVARLELSPSQVAEWFDTKADWARLNENLMQVSARSPDLDAISEKSLSGKSDGYLWLYRRKLIYFVPGVMGSKIDIRDAKGNVTPIFPSYGFTGENDVGFFECDEEGKPLYKTETQLFELFGYLPFSSPSWLEVATVYDITDRLVAQWKDRCDVTGLPNKLRAISVVPWPYDWRLNLEDTAQKMFSDLQERQRLLRREDDTDDRLAISGHSTGGLIIRRVSGLPGADQVVDHTFFMNVPFRGAPKAVSVFVFGGDPPKVGLFKALLPSFLLATSSLLAIAANMPILYFLSPSPMYPDQVAAFDLQIPQWTPQFAFRAGVRQEEQEKITNFAAYCGVIVPPRPVMAGLSQSERERVARASNDWNEVYWQFMQEAAKRHGVPLSADVRKQARMDALVRSRSGEVMWSEQRRQKEPRAGWNPKIAQDAARFHRESEANIGSNDIKLWIFWSQTHTTFGKLSCSVLEKKSFAEGRPESAGTDNEFTFVVKDVNQKAYYKIKFDGTGVDGDGTVPRASLLGIGTSKNVAVFKPIPGNPNHVASPNYPYVWDRVLEVLLGYNTSNHWCQPHEMMPVNKPAKYD